MPISFLPERSVVSLSGEDTISFLQGLVSNDTRKLERGKEIYAAMLSPQGKYQHDFFLIPWQGKIFVDIAAGRADDFVARLKLYRLRSKVEIALESNLAVAVIYFESPQPSENNNYKLYEDPRLADLGFRVIGNKEDISQLGFNFVDQLEYEKNRLSLCVPDSCDMIVDKSLLMECDFERLHGIDFNKGCYIGQEVTTRSKFRGGVRKSFYKTESNETLPDIATPILARNHTNTPTEKNIGEIRSSLGKIGIALINNDDYETAMTSHADFFCGDKKIRIYR